MPSLITTLSLNASKFNADLDKVIARTQKAGGTWSQNLVGALTNNSIFRAFTAPWSAAFAFVQNGINAIIDKEAEAAQKRRELIEGVSRGAIMANMDPRQYQMFYLAAQAAGVEAESIAKVIRHMAMMRAEMSQGGEAALKYKRALAELGLLDLDARAQNAAEVFKSSLDVLARANLSDREMDALNVVFGEGAAKLRPLALHGVDRYKGKGLSDPERAAALLEAGKAIALADSRQPAFGGDPRRPDQFGGAFGGISQARTYGFSWWQILTLPFAGEEYRKKLQQIGIQTVKDRLAREHPAAGPATEEHRQRQLGQVWSEQQADWRAQNTEKAAALSKEVAQEEKLSKLRTMPAPQRLAELQKENEAIDQRIEKMKTMDDPSGLFALRIAEAQRDRAKNATEMATLRQSLTHSRSIELDQAQRLGGYVAANSINTVQNMALQESRQHTALLREIRDIQRTVAKGSRSGVGSSNF